MSSDKRKLINNYFDFEEPDLPTLKKYARYGLIVLILGILMLYLEQAEIIGDFTVISVVFILVGLFSLWILIKPFISSGVIFSSKAADGDMDIWFSEDIHEVIKPKALEQLKINSSSIKDENIIIVPYPVYWQLPDFTTEQISRKIGEDGTYTYSIWMVQILIVTDNFISYYSCIYDWINSSIHDERTNEYFFDDIASVSNDTFNLEYKFIDNEELEIGIAKVFKLTNMSGERLSILTDIPSLNVPEGYSNNLERLVQAIRILLRNRRYGEEIEVSEKNDTNAGDVVFEVENKTKDKGKVYFHQQLRELYNEYNQETEEDE